MRQLPFPAICFALPELPRLTVLTFCSPEEKSTHYLQYTYLLLYLRRRAEAALSPLERMVRDKVR